ncbi:MAG: hypothetical protein NC181_03680 [Clostridium sp.]|nr:hypothetical protein [Clostridium sp.]MCM1444279.1 hypothetical protein [Candidatus Amulumruptor caecigallinarius]
MSALKENYFIKQLENGKNLKVCFMVHNAYWCYLEKINKHYPNCKIDVYGSSMHYFTSRNKDFNLEKNYNYDLIIVDAASLQEIEELYRMEIMASKISYNNQKDVTIGYVYFLPPEERVNEVSRNFIVETFKNGEKNSVDNISIPNDTVYDLLNITLKKHEEIDKTKKYIK